MAQEKKLKTFNEFLYENEVKWADMVYLRQPINGVWHDITWKETMLRARKVAAFLKSLGLAKGDKVAIFSKNCAEWFIADFAIAIGGFVSIPLFATQHKENIHYVLEHAEVKAIFVGKLDNWQAQEEGIPKEIPRIAFPYENSMPAQYQWNDIMAEFKPLMENYIPELDDLYTIMYTSGTTGHPKGAMINYRALAHASELIYEEGIFTNNETNYFFSYLPLGHIFERMAIEYNSILTKSTVAFAESLATFAQNLHEISPNFFIGVPRIWAQFQKGILAKMPQHKLDILLRIPLISSLIKRKIREALGLNKSTLNGSGSAPISPSLIEWYDRLGIVICEGYGRTEDLTYATINLPGTRRIGTVGLTRPGIEIKISEEGEILTRSKMMMVGYYKDPEATKKVFTEDGFLRTGDLGHFDEAGYLIIHGRVNDSFKTDKGEFVNPIPIEGRFGKNTNIEQMCLMGLNLPQPVLLVVLSATAHKMDRKQLETNLKGTLDSINTELTKYEKISHIIVAKEPWTPENNLLTPTLKMKRNALHDKYLDIAQKVVESTEPIIWEQ